MPGRCMAEIDKPYLYELINASGISPDALDMIAFIDRIWHMQAEHKAASPPPESSIEPAPAT